MVKITNIILQCTSQQCPSRL